MRTVLDQRFSDFILIDRPDLYERCINVYEDIVRYDKLAADIYDCNTYNTSLDNIEDRKEKVSTAGKLLFNSAIEIVKLNAEFKKQYGTSFLREEDTSNLEGCLSIVTDYCEIGERLRN